MLKSLALIFLFGLILGNIFKKLNLPKIIGYLLAGIFLGPFVFNFLDSKILSISEDLRKLALIIILLRAGFSLNLTDLKRVGRSAILMSFLPATFEIIAYMIFAPLLLKITLIEAAVMGTVMSAVSPAVVVPRMINYIENKWGTKKSIPQMIMASASIDDIFVIVIFTTLLGVANGGNTSIIQFINIPISIITGILLGYMSGLVLHKIFEGFGKEKINNSVKIIIILSISFLMIAIENAMKNYISISGLLAVLSLASVLKIKMNKSKSRIILEKLNNLWIVAEILLFVLVGAAVDIRYTLVAGLPALLLIILALMIRTIGVLISIIGTDFSMKEKMFCVISYLPKATVQAAIGSIPLSVGLASGNLILSLAVLGIIVTAPIGAIGMDYSYKKLLKQDK